MAYPLQPCKDAVLEAAVALAADHLVSFSYRAVFRGIVSGLTGDATQSPAPVGRWRDAGA